VRVGLKRRVRELSQRANQPRVHRGELAEVYDGIGQYVMVALSRSSVASAYKARIASGDFGTGQQMPIGTPILVTAIHGRLEIISMGAK
jgi:hypothetical protein